MNLKKINQQNIMNICKMKSVNPNNLMDYNLNVRIKVFSFVSEAVMKRASEMHEISKNRNFMPNIKPLNEFETLLMNWVHMKHFYLREKDVTSYVELYNDYKYMFIRNYLELRDEFKYHYVIIMYIQPRNIHNEFFDIFFKDSVNYRPKEIKDEIYKINSNKDYIAAYRGASNTNLIGYSYSLDKNVAEKFVINSPYKNKIAKSRLIKVKIPKKNILGWGEKALKEIIVHTKEDIKII